MTMPVVEDLDFESSARLLNLPAPASDTEPARLAEVKAAFEGIKNKDPVTVRAQANVNLSSPGATVDSQTLTAGDRVKGSVLLTEQADPTENGLYIWNGASTPMTRAADASTATELNTALVTVSAGTDAGKSWRQTATLTTLGSDSVVWTPAFTGAGQASTTAAGIVELATQAEVDAGADASRAVTPETLASWSGRLRKVSTVIGNGSDTQIDVAHNLNSRDVLVSVHRNSGSYDTVLIAGKRISANTVRFNFAQAPSLNQFVVVVEG